MSGEVTGALVGAVKGTLSVLLTMLTGHIAARVGIIDKGATRRISRLCSGIFLPCLLVSQIGGELQPKELRTAWIVPVWGIVSTMFGYGLGWAGKVGVDELAWKAALTVSQRVLRLPAWTILAAGRPNSTALPLMVSSYSSPCTNHTHLNYGMVQLLNGLAKAGVLDSLQAPGESRSRTLARAKSLILLNVVVQQCITFMAGPNILEDDKPDKHARDHEHGDIPTIQDREHVGLLHDYSDSEDEEDPRTALDRLENVPDLPKFELPQRLQFLHKVVGVLNPPLVGALLAALIWAIPPIHHALFNENGALYVPIATPIDNLGDVYVALQTFVVGAELAVVGWADARPGVKPTTFALLIRFIVMPAVALLFVWVAASHSLINRDPLIL